MNKGRILHALDDQFEAVDSAPNALSGFNFVLTRKKPGGSSSQYQYKIGAAASIIVSDKEYKNKLQPKLAGEWIDITYNGKEIYLYLECQLSVKSRDSTSDQPQEYAVSSAKLITTDSSLPKNFSGTYVKKLNKQGFNYYETTLIRKFLAILIFNKPPVSFYSAQGVVLSEYGLNGISKYRI
jgi:hypothetical protein